MPTLSGSGFVFEGLHHSSYRVEYTENADCMSHYTLPEIIALPENSNDLTLHQMWQRAAKNLSSDQIVIEFSRDVIHKLTCPACSQEQEVCAPFVSFSSEPGPSPADGNMRVVQ